ncbi:MAG: phosphoribosylformylglycinamidine synthase subunit PurS [candidate division Zixibacteria bacterium]|nr:phosphoribosylformylglycinamidine synthase subunit PurS [candidate division Zixibacteria bacterium]MBU1471736.1 phosphoribosylformylglycinamidine synthase subunit PurS [candidate division Zixibacteria bacterium]MBU2625166.1 phosphoribosylformylglycinamidine synthase subunit PurS [candidate division Zixibacteria bacterium]
MTKATVRVELKDGVLDPQGVTIKNALKDMGYTEVGSVRSGKVFNLELDIDDKDVAKVKLEEMCSKLLANPVIEQYFIEVD